MTVSSTLPQSNKLFVEKSRIHGLGVMAKKNIKRGEVGFIIKGKIIRWKVRDEGEALYGEHWIGIGKDTWIDPEGFGRYINHSSKPSCGIRGSVTVCALRNIKKGEELTIDYSTTEQETLWWMEDYSGKKKKQIVRAVQFLPQEKFKSYLPYVPKYFQKVYRQHHKVTS